MRRHLHLARFAFTCRRRGLHPRRSNRPCERCHSRGSDHEPISAAPPSRAPCAISDDAGSYLIRVTMSIGDKAPERHPLTQPDGERHERLAPRPGATRRSFGQVHRPQGPFLDDAGSLCDSGNVRQPGLATSLLPSTSTPMDGSTLQESELQEPEPMHACGCQRLRRPPVRPSMLHPRREVPGTRHRAGRHRVAVHLQFSARS
jgi:hypothetical protein